MNLANISKIHQEMALPVPFLMYLIFISFFYLLSLSIYVLFATPEMALPV